MGGTRCAGASGRPEFLERLKTSNGGTPLPITAVAAATASLKHENLVSERKQLNAAIRQKTFDWLATKGYDYVPSETNFFMVDTKRPATQVFDEMPKRNAYIRQLLPVSPAHVR